MSTTRRAAVGRGAVALAVFALAALVATRGWGRGADLAVVRWSTGLPDLLGGPGEVVLLLGTIPGVLLLWAPVTALRFRSLAAVATVLLVGVAARAAAIAAKSVFELPRPTADLTTVRERLTDFGFPSGHTAVAAALAALGWAWVDRRRDRVGLALVVALVGALRWYVGAHFVVDVVGGAALGVAIGSAATAVVGRPVASPR